MDLTSWYAIALVALAATIYVLKIASRVISSIWDQISLYFLRDVFYAFLGPQWYWSRATRSQALLIASYTAANGFGMGFGIRTSNDLIARTGIMASINFIPLLLGGRTNLAAEILGTSLHTYYLAHHWVGRMVILQSMIHVGLVIAKGEPWTLDAFQISGISSASALALIMVLSLYFIRRAAYEIFLKLHFILALGATIALFNHLLPRGITRFIYPLTALGVWVLNCLARIVRVMYYTSRIDQRNGIEIKQLKKPAGDGISAICLDVHFRRPFEIRGGQYFYILFSDLGLRRKFQAHPFMVAWWDETKMSFLIQPRDGLTWDLRNRTSIRSIILDGPYGKDLELMNYAKSLLLAKGIGICGLLPYALSLMKRKTTETRGVLTQKVDLYWILEENCQIEWIRPWIEKLKGIDPNRVTLRLFCYSPTPRETSIGSLKDDKDKWYAYFYGQMPNIPGLIKKMNENHEDSIIAGWEPLASAETYTEGMTVCGDAVFATAVRNIQREKMCKSSKVTFDEVEFRPQHNNADRWDQNWKDVFHRQMSEAPKAPKAPEKRSNEISRLTNRRSSSRRLGGALSKIEEEDEVAV